MKKSIKYFAAFIAFCCLFASCAPLNTDAVFGSDGPAIIFPDYKDVTIPYNIAPLNFHYAIKDAKSAVTTFTVDGQVVTKRGLEIKWKSRQWDELMEAATGKTISVASEVKTSEGTINDSWTICVSEDPVDSYLTYRSIEPAYQMFNEVSILERNVENFDITTICDYKHTDNSCMNCHTHAQQRGDLSMFYIRGPHGGAILNRGGELRKLTLNAEGMLSGTVYGEIHPSGRFGVFSTNIIIPAFHSMAGKRMEVYDTASDLTVADFDNNRMINLSHVAASDKLETFPCFSADGESVFYCVADTVSLPEKIEELKYSLVRADFDSSNGNISEKVDTIWNADAHNASVCHPKASPDGKWIMFTVADYGTFPIDHRECRLVMVNLETGEVKELEGVKNDSSGSDTYHSWSSNGKWFVFASKRGDGHYAKPYFCHLDDNGNPSKPFVLPQKSPRFYEFNLKSFNVPDMGNASIGVTVSDAKRLFKAQSEVFE